MAAKTGLAAHSPSAARRAVPPIGAATAEMGTSFAPVGGEGRRRYMG